MTRRERISIAVCGLAVGVSILAIGGAPHLAQSAVAVIVAGGLAMLVPSRHGFERIPPLVALLGVAAAWTFLQWLPLPGGLASLLNPELAALREDGALIAGVSPRAALTADPPGTLRALTFLLTLSGVAVLAVRTATSERGRFWLVAAIGAVTGLAAVLSGLHAVLDARSLYGLYTPAHIPPLLGPLLNTNHLGGLMATGALCNVGLFLHRKQASKWRIGWAAAGLACLAATMATLSRGAVIALAGGAVVMLAVLFVQRVSALRDQKSRRRREQFLTTTLPIAIVVTCGLVIAVFFGAGSVMQQIETTSLKEIDAPTSKFAAWQSTATLIGDMPWTGVGRGAFEAAFTRVHPASALVTFSHAENEPLQAIAEWGIPMAIVLALLAGWMLLTAVRRWNDGPLAASALGVVVAIAFQSCFDFGMELLGLAVPVVIVLATLTYVPLGDVKRKPVARGIRVAHGVVVLVGALLLQTALTEPLDVAHRNLKGASRAQITASIARHPHDYLGYSALATDLAKAGRPEAVAVLNHALRLHPSHPSLHWIAARLLVRDQLLAQAESEYALAAKYQVNIAALLSEVVRTLPPERAARVLPVTLPVEVTVRSLRSLDKNDVAMLWLERVMAVRRDTRAVEAMAMLAAVMKDPVAAERAARRRCELVPGPACKLALAGVLAAAGRHADVIVELRDVESWSGLVDQHVAGWLLLCDSHQASGQPAKARECLLRLTTSGIIEPSDVRITSRLERWRP